MRLIRRGSRKANRAPTWGPWLASAVVYRPAPSNASCATGGAFLGLPLGQPPFWPFLREAAALRRDLAWPPRRPRAWAWGFIARLWLKFPK